MKRAIKDHWKDFAAIVGLLLIAGGVSAVILGHQRFRFPFISSTPVRMYAAIDTAQAVTAGQGQTVEVAGVNIGLIANVELHAGHAVIGLDIQPKFKNLIHTDASALLRPRTGLQDMFLQVDPGSRKAPVAHSGFTIPESRTMAPINLDQILAGLDRDTRDHLQLLLSGAAMGLHGRSMDLANLFKRYGPTTRDLRRVNEAVAKEREGLKDAVHGLALVSNELAGKQDQLARLVQSSAAVFQAFASEDHNLSATVQKLPGALKVTTATLGDVQRFAEQLGPTTTALTPVFQELDRTNRVITPIAQRLTPVVRDQIRPFVRAARPLVQDLRPAAKGLAKATPDTTTTLLRLNHLFNLLAYNPGGAQPADTPNRQEGYLFWLAWLTHQTANLINVDDANGPMRPVFLTGTCQTLTNLVNDNPAAEFGFALTNVLANQCNNPSTTSVLPGVVRKQVARQARAFNAQQKAAGTATPTPTATATPAPAATTTGAAK